MSCMTPDRPTPVSLGIVRSPSDGERWAEANATLQQWRGRGLQAGEAFEFGTEGHFRVIPALDPKPEAWGGPVATANPPRPGETVPLAPEPKPDFADLVDFSSQPKRMVTLSGPLFAAADPVAADTAAVSSNLTAAVSISKDGATHATLRPMFKIQDDVTRRNVMIHGRNAVVQPASRHHRLGDPTPIAVYHMDSGSLQYFVDKKVEFSFTAVDESHSLNADDVGRVEPVLTVRPTHDGKFSPGGNTLLFSFPPKGESFGPEVLATVRGFQDGSTRLSGCDRIVAGDHAMDVPTFHCRACGMSLVKIVQNRVPTCHPVQGPAAVPSQAERVAPRSHPAPAGGLLCTRAGGPGTGLFLPHGE